MYLLVLQVFSNLSPKKYWNILSQLYIPAARARYGEGKDRLLGSNPNLLGVLLVPIVYGVSPVYGARGATTFKLKMYH